MTSPRQSWRMRAIAKGPFAAVMWVAGLSSVTGVCAGQSPESLSPEPVLHQAPALPPAGLPGDGGAVQLKAGESFDPYRNGGPPPWDRGPIARGPSMAVALDGARAAITACRAQAMSAVAVSVVDSAGQPRLTLAADGVRGWHAYSATRKALTALAFAEPSSKVAGHLAADATLAARLESNMTTLPGAVPLLSGDLVVGAIGISGSRSGEQDEKCAMAGAAAMRAGLRNAFRP